MSASSNPFLEATLSRCLEEQYHAAECHLRAASWMEFRRDGARANALHAATREQMIGAHHAEQARIRLDRINGHA